MVLKKLLDHVNERDDQIQNEHNQHVQTITKHMHNYTCV